MVVILISMACLMKDKEERNQFKKKTTLKWRPSLKILCFFFYNQGFTLSVEATYIVQRFTHFIQNFKSRIYIYNRHKNKTANNKSLILKSSPDLIKQGLVFTFK